MDVQGLEKEVLRGGRQSMESGAIRTFLIGTHGRARGLTIHDDCRELLRSQNYKIEIDQPAPAGQPDGILVASK